MNILQESPIMQAASQSLNLRRNALDVASAGHASAAPPSGGQYLQDLGSLQSSIRGASVQDLKDPDSECRIAIDVLVNFAAAAGPTGANARTALCDVYSESIGPEKRNALLNAALEMTQQKTLRGDTASLSATVAFMGGVSSSPPDGKNGPGHIHAANALLAGKLGWPLDREPNLLAQDRAITDVELLAEGADLENLNVWDRPISMDTPNAKEEFVALGHQALRNQQLATVWMPGNSGHSVAVVAEPMPSGIKFLVIAHPEDEQGKKMEAALKEFFSGDPYTVSRYGVELPHMALSHLNDNVGNDRGAGHVIQEHADQWKTLNPEDQQAVTLVAQAKLFEAVAANGSQSPAQVLPATPEVALPVPPARAKSLEDNFNMQGLTVRSGQVHSAFDAFAEIFSLKDAMLLAPKNPQLMTSYLTTFYAQNDAPARGNFLRPALAFADGFNEDKAPLLFKDVDPSGPLASISKTLHGVGSGRKIIDLMVKHQQTLLQECRDAKDLSQLKNKLEEVVEVQAMLLGGINTAIADLEKFESEDLTSLNPEIAAQAKAQAKDLLAVSKRYRECLTSENSAEGNVYADFVAFAKQATTFGPSLEAAQAMFRGIGGKARTVPTPDNSLDQPPAPPIVVNVPDDLSAIQAPPKKVPTRAEIVEQRGELLVAQKLRAVTKLKSTNMGDHGIFFQVQAPVHYLSSAINARMKMTGASPRVRQENERIYDSELAQLESRNVKAEYIEKIVANQNRLAGLKAKNTITGQFKPLEAAANAIMITGFQAAFTGQYLTRRCMLLENIYKELLENKPNPAAVKKLVAEMVSSEEAFFFNINFAIGKLNELIEPSPETLLSWKQAGITEKAAEQIKQDAAAYIDAFGDARALAKHAIFDEFRNIFSDSEDDFLVILTEQLTALERPKPPTNLELSALAGAAGFGRSTEPNSALAKAMAQVQAAQDRPLTRPLFGQPLNKQAGALAKLNLVTTPDQLDKNLQKVADDAKAVQLATSKLAALVKGGVRDEPLRIAQGVLAMAKNTFLKTLAATRQFVESQIDVVDESIEMLKSTEKSSAGARVKADATHRREALEGLRTQWEDEAGPWRQIVKFTEIGDLYPDQVLEALNQVGVAS
jgi:hypothetical protein